MKYLMKNPRQNSAKKINLNPKPGDNCIIGTMQSRRLSNRNSFVSSYPKVTKSTKKNKETDLYGTLKGKSRKELNKYSISMSRMIAGVIAELYIEKIDEDKITKQVVTEIQHISKLVAETLPTFSEEWKDLCAEVIVTKKIQDVINSREKNNSE